MTTADTPGSEGEDERTRLVLAQPVSETPVPPPAAAVKEPKRATVARGTRINNNYIVGDVLKIGGMGEVYRGENVFTGDPVAIKVVLQELAEDEQVGQMFLREARMLSQLSDDAIVRYYNFVKDPQIDRYCLVMEFIEGVTLADHTFRNGGLSREQGLQLMRRLARGLDRAHARGVIHRDLSPDNVMLPHGVVADALLIDFGIAKSNLLQESTMAGQFAGKFKYVSPEQLGHYGGEIGPATDIYGLALLMAAALRGKPLEMGSSIVEAVDARRAIPNLDSLPEAFRPLLSWMLEPDPTQRVASMAEVIRLIDRPGDIPAKYRAGLTHSAPPGSLSLPPGRVAGLALPPAVTARPVTLPPVGAAGIGSGQVRAVPRPAEPAQDVALAGLRRGGPLLLLGGVFVLMMTGALGFAWWQGFFDPAPDLPQSQPVAGPDGSSEGAGSELAGLPLGSCTLAIEVPAASDKASLQVFSNREERFAELALDYQRRFGVQPVVQGFLVNEDQCPALEFAQGFQTGAPEALTLTSAEVTSGSPIEGSVAVPDGQSLWLAVVSPRGGVYKLNQSLSGQIAGVQAFSFGLTLAEGSAAAPQLVLAVASPSPLANAAAARDGADAAELLPLVAEELNTTGGTVSVGHVLLRPEGPAVAPEPGPEEATP